MSRLGRRFLRRFNVLLRGFDRLGGGYERLGSGYYRMSAGLDMFGHRRIRVLSDRQAQAADEAATRSDWDAVGQDMVRALCSQVPSSSSPNDPQTRRRKTARRS